ncbi:MULTISPECIES: Flp pilus assembly protein CpaB [unclassified Cryobacterium]|uniref:Flp pilus assembly protein CpaB n=1 Tax=unclassified Cryobacterium TaxID=2649013 RepID=UPI001069CF00|nr:MULTISPECIES: RcpC/CpaB family pilus assembly protein [unclassified Cryobacterium]TFD09293.1 Flp pilus assembly protein CpaB [Cryobacterium sp. TMT1-66-1]TFD14897.1 Flp pilus assembly protein CpaB [Cryobacterium sp. TMT1-2-2]
MKTRLIGAIVAIILALVGTFALTGYVRGADARAADGAALVSVFVVTTQIPQGTKAEDITTFIEQKQIPAVAAVPGRVTKLSALAGTVADAALVPGEQLISSRWVEAADLAARGDVKVPDGMQVLTLALPLERVVGGVLKAGDTVGVVITATKTVDGTEMLLSKQVFHKVLVTAVQAGTTTTPDAGADATPVSVIMVTLARTTPDIESLVWGQQFGTVWLTIEPDNASETGSRVVDGSEMFR